MTDVDQLLLNFNQKKNFENDNFYVSKSNFLAYETLNKWPRWEKNILNIYGEKYSGKTHLANIFKKKSKTKYILENELNDEIFKDLKLYECIILDNFENIISERILYTLFNFIDQSNKYLLIISEKPINKFKFDLRDLSSRAKNCLFAEIEMPIVFLNFVFSIFIVLFCTFDFPETENLLACPPQIFKIKLAAI